MVYIYWALVFTVKAHKAHLVCQKLSNHFEGEVFGSFDTEKEKTKKKKMSLVWLEAALPLGIIGGMLCIMGNSQYYIHKAYHGRV